MPNVIFSVFDKDEGPHPLYYSNFLLKDALAIAARSQMALSFTVDYCETESEAIIPFPEINKISYVNLFTIPSKAVNSECLATISYLVDLKHQMDLYRDVFLLRYAAKEVSSRIKSEFVYSPGSDLPSHLKKHLDEWGANLQTLEFEMEEEVRKKKITIKNLSKEGSFSFLYQTLGKNLDIVLHSLIIGIPLILTGDPHAVKLGVASLELFAPHRILRKVPYTEEFVNPKEADVIGVDKELLRFYPESEYTIVDFKTNKVYGGKRSKFFRKLITGIENLTSQEAKKRVNEQIYYLVAHANELLEVFSESPFDYKSTDNLITSIIEQLGVDGFEIVVALASNANPHIAKLMRETITFRYSHWMKSL